MRKYSMLPKGLLSAPNTASRELRKTLSIISRRCSPLLSKTGSARAISPRPRATATATADARRSIKFLSAFSAGGGSCAHSRAGTHTLGVALFGLLRPGDTMLSVTGQPYDTIHPVIGITGEGMGSLKDFGVKYEQVDLNADGRPIFPR